MLSIPPNEWKQLNYSKRRSVINKEKKRQIRVTIAKQRKTEQEKFEEYLNSEEGIEEQRIAENSKQKEEAERLLRHEEWLERERTAQEEFKQKKEREDKKIQEREERERMIREEWEEIEKRQRKRDDERKGISHSKEVLLEKELAGIDQTLGTIDEPWHNPFAPIDAHQSSSTRGGSKDVTILEESTSDPIKNYGTEKDKVNCPFYLKTGACRYGDRCSRHHAIPPISSTLIIPGMYVSAIISRQYHDDQDAELEVDENELFEDYEGFYKDVFPAFAECGKIVQFKVSRNFEPHLRGNVYVQFSRDEECSAAFKVFNGRWYAGKQLSCQYSPVQKWRTAICGLYNNQQCPKGKNCNFLHVFENPGGAYKVDHIDQLAREDSPRIGRHHRRHSTRHDSNRSPISPRRHSPSRQGERRRRRQPSYSPPRRRQPSYSPPSRRQTDLKKRQRSPHYYTRRRHSSPERSRSRSKSPRRRKERSPSYCSSEDERSLRRNRRDKDSDLLLEKERSSGRSSKRKRKSKTKHKKHKQKRHSNNSNDSDDNGDTGGDNGDTGDTGGMKEIMEQVLRDISID